MTNIMNNNDNYFSNVNDWVIVCSIKESIVLLFSKIYVYLHDYIHNFQFCLNKVLRVYNN